MSQSWNTLRREAPAVRAGWGALLLGAPGLVLRSFGHRPVRPQTLVVRALGARHLAQAALISPTSPRWTRVAGAAVDGLHAATAVALGVADRRWRRAVLADAAVAGAFMTAGWALAVRPPRPRSG